MAINFKRLHSEGWNYLKQIFPKTFVQIKKWHESTDDEGNPYMLWLNGRLYDFFDNRNIFICIRVNEESKFIVEVWHKGVKTDMVANTKSRKVAEYEGFMIAFEINEETNIIL